MKGTKVKQYKLPKLTAKIDPELDLVYGKAPKNRWFDIELRDGYHWYHDWMQSGADGKYAWDLSSMVDLVAGRSYNVYMSYMDGRGNISFRSKIINVK